MAYHLANFEAVRRLPGGHALRVGSGIRSIERYWDPIAPGRPIDYVSDEETGLFDDLLDQAVERCLPSGPVATYMSGGLDSVSVAALAQEQLDAAVRAYYQGDSDADAEDDAWGKATSPQSHRAWDED